MKFIHPIYLGRILANNAVLSFTKAALNKRGKVNDNEIETVKNQGFDDQEIVEIIAMISFINLANFIANVGEPELDFLEAPILT